MWSIISISFRLLRLSILPSILGKQFIFLTGIRGNFRGFHLALSSVIVWRRQWQPTPVFLPGKSHGQRRLVGYSPWGHEESDTTEWLHFCFSLSCTGEGNGNPLQYFSWRIPGMGAWWAASYGVAQSQTRLTWLSSSSSVIVLAL